MIKGSAGAKQLSRPITKIAVAGIALGLAVMIITIGIVVGFQEEIRNKLIGFGSHIQVTNYDNNSSDEPRPISKIQPFLNDVKSDPEVAHIQMYATKSGIIKTKTDNEGVLLKGIGSDFDWSYINSNMKAGQNFSVSDTGLSRSIVISKHLSDKLGLGLNDKMVIYFLTRKEDENVTEYEQRVKTFYISGIYETGYEDIDKKLVLVDIGQIQKLNYWDDDQVGGFEIALTNFENLDEKGEMINIQAGQGLLAQTIKEVNPTVFSWLDLQDLNAIIVIVLMLLVAGINMISALLILILERTNMIGILKSMGASNASIRKIFLYNAVYLIGKGMIIGNILGLGLAILQQQTGMFTLDQTQYYVSVIPVNIDPVQILLLNIGTMVACTLMLLLPSFIISRITPVKAIRFS
jgi:lipoprotein-releasing system permease protein